MNEATISSITDFQAQLDRLNLKSTQILFRGQPDASWPVTCSAARRLTQDSASPIRTQLIGSLLVGYLESLIARARLRRIFPPQLDADSSDLDFLAQLQHQGAATGLFDFTHNPLVALWFACHESHETDGAVFVLPRSRTKQITSAEALNIQIAYFYKGGVLWSWDPNPLGSRIEAQGSVFVFGGDRIANSNMERFVVKKHDKQDILIQLETQHDIHEEKIYPDFPGYATANSSYKPFDVKRSISYWEGQVELAHSNDQLAMANYNCGVAYGAAFDSARAIEYFDIALEHDPYYAGAYFNRGNAKSDLNCHAAAVRDYDKALSLEVDDSSIFRARGSSMASLGFPREAIRDYNRSLRSDPDDANCYNSRGLAKLALGDIFGAIDDHTTAIQLDSALELAYVNRSTARAKLGIHLGAIQDCNVAIRINPESVKAYINRGNCKHILGEHRAAIFDYEQAIRIDENSALAYHGRGNANLGLQLNEEADSDFSRAIRCDPEFALAYGQRSIARKLLDRIEDSRADLDRFTVLAQKGKTGQMKGHFEPFFYRIDLREAKSPEDVGQKEQVAGGFAEEDTLLCS